MGPDEAPCEAAPPAGDAEEVVDLGSLDLGPPDIQEGPAKRVERTRTLLAYLLLALLTGVIAALLAMLAARRLTPEEFGSVAGVLLSPIFGLLGAATGYYYGRSSR